MKRSLIAGIVFPIFMTAAAVMSKNQMATALKAPTLIHSTVTSTETHSPILLPPTYVEVSSPVSSHPAVFSQEQPDWSANGKQVAFASYRNKPDIQDCRDHCNSEIYVIHADGTDPIRLAENPAEDSFPAWLPISANIIYENTWMPQDFLRNGIVSLLCVGIIICLQKAYLNRIHTTLRTEYLLGNYFHSGHFSERGVTGLIADIYYTFSKMFILTSIVETVSKLILAVSIYPGYLPKVPATLGPSLALCVFTLILGHSYIGERAYIRIGTYQRIWAGVTFGLLLTITLQFLKGFPLQPKTTVILGLILLGSQLLTIYIIPKKITADHPYSWILDSIGIIPGSLIGWGLIEALKSKWLSLLSLTVITQYFFLIVSILLVGTSLMIGRELTQISTQVLSPSRHALVKFRIFMELLVNNLVSFSPFYLGTLSLPLTLRDNWLVMQTLDRTGIAIVSVSALIVFLMLNKETPRFLRTFIEAVGNQGVSTDYSTDDSDRPINPAVTVNVSYLDEETSEKIERQAAAVRGSANRILNISSSEADMFWEMLAADVEKSRKRQERADRKKAREQLKQESVEFWKLHANDTEKKRKQQDKAARKNIRGKKDSKKAKK